MFSSFNSVLQNSSSFLSPHSGRIHVIHILMNFNKDLSFFILGTKTNRIDNNKLFRSEESIFYTEAYMFYVHCTMYNVQCTMYNVQCTMYNVHCTMYNVQCVMYIVPCTLYIAHCTLYIVHCTLYIVHIKPGKTNYYLHLEVEKPSHHGFVCAKIKQ